MAGTCECGNEPSGSIKFGEFLDWLRTGWLPRKTLLHGVIKQASISMFVAMQYELAKATEFLFCAYVFELV